MAMGCVSSYYLRAGCRFSSYEVDDRSTLRKQSPLTQLVSQPTSSSLKRILATSCLFYCVSADRESRSSKPTNDPPASPSDNGHGVHEDGEGVPVAAPEIKLASVLCMKGGNDDDSYCNNSQAQARHASCLLPLLEETLEAIVERRSTSGAAPRGAPAPLFTVADLGCSCGNNTLFLVDVIVPRVASAYERRDHAAPEFQVFFSDLPSNDFNTLFQLLPPVVDSTRIEEPTGCRPYHAAGVPGSFYERLSPGGSIDVFSSTFSLHWLSRVPQGIIDATSPAYNRDRVSVHRATEATVTAYKCQFQSDLTEFLQSRAHELKRGSAVFLACLGRSSPDPADQGGGGHLFGTHFQDAWNDLVQEGLIEKKKRDSFNIPEYAPSLQELEDVVRTDGSFVVDKLELVRGGSPLVVGRPDDPAEVGRAMARSCKAVAAVLVEAHIGKRLSGELFERFERRVARHAVELMAEEMHFFHVVCSLTLT